MTRAEVKNQLNAFTDHYLRGVSPLKVDHRDNRAYRVRIESVKHYIGFGKNRHDPDSKVTEKFLRALASPKAKWLGRRVRLAGARRRLRQRAAYQKHRLGSSLWGGCRTVTNEVIRIVDGRVPVTSRKRTAHYGNPGSDHHVSQRNADAVDFGTANNHALKNEISRRLGGPRTLRDYGSFTVKRGGRTFRVQCIAATHGTGPHLHVGVRRA